MTTKLTLSVKRDVVEKAKRLSAKNGKSVSRMVEDYLRSLPEAPKKSMMDEIDEMMAPHRDRILKSIPPGKSYRDMVREWRYEELSKQLPKTKHKKTRNEK